MGSSPRVRGIGPPHPLMGVVAGIIPACAGNSAMARTSALIEGDHPRVCGE